MPAWPDRTIWWHLHPISFTGADCGAPRAKGRLARVEAWLDYLIDLGCNGLALGPVFASESHGYDTVDHWRIDPRLGTDADFDHLVAQCRDRGIRVLLDGVFNHVGRGHPAFADVLAHGRASRYAPWFRLDFGDGPGCLDYADFEGHRNLVALNHSEPAVAAYVTDVMRHWLDRGASGWRLDAAYAVPPQFWRTVLPAVRRDHPGAWFAGEFIHGDYVAAVRESGLDSVTQYELWKAIWSSLNDRNFFELAWALDRHNGFAARFLPLTFVGNHDVTRLASRLSHPAHLAHALVILFTVAGTPSVYAGDEQAFRGIKHERAGGDAEIRPEFPASPAQLAQDGWPAYRLHQALIALRRRHPWLARARTEVLHLDNTTLAYRATPPKPGSLQPGAPPKADGLQPGAPALCDGCPGLVVLLNAADRPVTFSLEGLPPVRALSSDDSLPHDQLPPHGWAILDTPP
jgi:cyclomaltodextrinase / maltogenic alpha-amylase / neopullulanase